MAIPRNQQTPDTRRGRQAARGPWRSGRRREGRRIVRIRHGRAPRAGVDGLVRPTPDDSRSRECRRHQRSRAGDGPLESRRPCRAVADDAGRRCHRIWRLGRRLRARGPRHRGEPRAASGRAFLQDGSDGDGCRFDGIPRHGHRRGSQGGYADRRHRPGRSRLFRRTHRRADGSRGVCPTSTRRQEP